MAIYNNYKAEFSQFAEHLNHSSAESVVKSVRKKDGVDGLIKLAKTATKSKCAQDQAIRDLIKKSLKEAKEHKPDKSQKKKIKKIVKSYEELKKEKKQSHQNGKPADQAAKEPAKKTAQPTVASKGEKVDMPASVVGLIDAFLKDDSDDWRRDLDVYWEDSHLDALHRLNKEKDKKKKEVLQLDQLLAVFTQGTGKKEAVEEGQKYKKYEQEVNQKIREAIEKSGSSFTFPEGLKDKLSAVTSLDLKKVQIPITAQVLREIAIHMPHLSRLNLSLNTLSEESIAALSQFNNLRHLHLGYTKMTDKLLSMLTCCKNLETLDLSGSDITTLQPLTSCIHLRDLRLYNCPISNLQPLASCTGLRALSLHSCTKISDLKPLASCTRLQVLDLRSCCEIRDIQALASCSDLRSLTLASCPRIPNLQPLASCTRLEFLNLENAFASNNVQPLASCTHLQRLLFCCSIKISDKQRAKLEKASPGLKIIADRDKWD